MDGDIRFNVGANTAQFDAKMSGVGNVANTTANKIKSAFSGLGGVLAGGAILAGLKSMMNDFDRVGKLATRFGTSAESIQRVGVAAKVAGTDVEAVANAMTKAGIAASKAVEQGGTMAELFDRAGINAREFAKANIDEKLLMIAEAYRAAGNDAQKTNAIIEIMGSRAGGNLIPLISNVEALRAEMANVSVATDETVRAIEQANDRMTRFGNSVKVAFAGGLQLVTEFSERLGSIMGGGGGRTIAEMDEAEMRANAENALRRRGELLPDDSTRRRITIPTPAGPVTSEADEFVPGPNAEENARRVNAEIEKMRAELEAAAKATAGITDEMDEQVPKAEQRKQQQQELNDLALQIKEAQAAGNQALADDLREYESLVRAAIKYEDDLEKAARDVNAEHRERLRLQDAALQKSIAQVEKEVELAETMAFGTSEAKKKAEWMKVYNEVLAKTGRDDLARRAANAETAEPERSGSFAGGGGFSPAPASQSNLDRLRAAAQTDPTARAALMRLQSDEAQSMGRAGDLREIGRFNSAARAEMRAERRAEQQAQNFNAKQLAMDRFGGNNMGEAFRNFRDMMAEQGVFGTSQKDFEKWAKEQAKSEKQREQEAAAGGVAAKDEKPQDHMSRVAADITEIKNVLTRADGIHDRLPIRVLAA
jgi:hypothetical protein